jgi:hypothetical protein
MAFRNQALPAQIRSGNDSRLRQLGQPPAGFSQGAAARAKVAAGKFSEGDPGADAAAPWFVGMQPFSQIRAANQNVFNDWDDRFTNATDIGFRFRPPPPEPEPAPVEGGSSSGGEEVKG